MPSHAWPSMKVCRTDSKTQSPIYLGLDSAGDNGMRDQTEFIVARRALLHFFTQRGRETYAKASYANIVHSKSATCSRLPRFLV